MEIRKLRITQDVVGAICDMCHKPCVDPNSKTPDYEHEYGTLSASWGYYSNGKDLSHDECHLCENCFDEVRAFIQNKGGNVRTITVSAFESTGPAFRKKKGIDFVEEPWLLVGPFWRDELLPMLDEIKAKWEAKKKEDDELTAECHRLLEEEKKEINNVEN